METNHEQEQIDHITEDIAKNVMKTVKTMFDGITDEQRQDNAKALEAAKETIRRVVRR